MIKLDQILFSVNEYDYEGEVSKRGVFLHFGDTRIHVAKNRKEFSEVAKRIVGMVDEIIENYPHLDKDE